MQRWGGAVPSLGKYYFFMKTTLSIWPLLLALALAGTPALAQNTPPALGTPPAAPTPDSKATDDYLLGRTYRVETVQGTTFTGMLVSMSLTRLEFNTQEMGQVSLERTQLRRAELQGLLQASTKPGYFDIGNGNRLFFAPTARGLRKGEATLQSVNLYLVGLNYGLTDNISVGGYVSLIPGLSPNEQFLVLTPKLSFPINEKLHVGAGLLYVRVPDFGFNNNGGNSNSTGAGIGYGALTYGSADDNFTFGLGYGFVAGEIGSTPVLQVGGQKRVSRRVSLVSENYIIADSRAGLGGLYGVKINWRRTSLGLGALYVYGFGYEDDFNGRNSGRPGYGFSTYVLPVYYDFTFRFGKGAK